MRVISLKNLVIKSLREHAEKMFGYSWIDKECIGPFIIFRDGSNKLHHIWGNKNDDKIYLDGEVTVNPSGAVEIHGNLIKSVREIFDIDPIQSIAVHGRMWKFTLLHSFQRGMISNN